MNDTLLIGLTGLVTAVLVKGGDFLLKWLSQRNQDQSVKERLKRDGYELTILYLDSEIKQLRADNVALRAENSAVRAEHTKCLVEQSEIRQQVFYLKEEIVRLKKDESSTNRRV